ncbi:WD-40 repeat-containing protein [Reticulomyxa filosa]|uniref:WD-40 repeat-containing protein n=1 Tax=Reticulomyxa filosa TaxID=46433 RepID=X6MP40_RETFI|nr:WD-40 repeat-containing protein [Reticulomyxa filosa]|eukprot:ETO15401.1 WD-40 repeat-containing protein [Reticulomyxa filosa]
MKKVVKMDNENSTLKQQLLQRHEDIRNLNSHQVKYKAKEKIILEKDTEITRYQEKIDEQKEKEHGEMLVKSKSKQLPTLNFDTFRSSKLLKTFNGHSSYVYSIDHSTFDGKQFLCSGSADNTVRVWDIENGKQIQSFNKHSNEVICTKFSSYHYINNRNVVCSSSSDQTIRFWDIQDDKQLQVFSEHTRGVCGIDFSLFSGGRYLCSGSHDKTIRLWDIKTSKSLHVLKGHTDTVWCTTFSPSQFRNNDNRSDAGIIGGNGYTICSGSYDNTVRLWDVETLKQLIIFRGHEGTVNNVQYSPYDSEISGSANTILSSSSDKSIRLWDVRSRQQIQLFRGHTGSVYVAEYSPYINSSSSLIDWIKGEVGNSNVICSGSLDETIRFWDIRSAKELHTFTGNSNDGAILCLKFFTSHKKDQNKQDTNSKNNSHLYYGSIKGTINILG